MRRPWAALLVLAALLGCSGVRTYTDNFPKNLHVKTRVDSGSAVTSTVAEFDIHRVNARCETEYRGRVYLDRPVVDVGVPVDQPLYLDFIFASKAFLSSNVSATRYTTLLTPRSGHVYDIQVSYDRGLYNVVIKETRRGSSAGRILERKPLSECAARGR